MHITISYTSIKESKKFLIFFLTEKLKVENSHLISFSVSGRWDLQVPDSNKYTKNINININHINASQKKVLKLERKHCQR